MNALCIRFNPDDLEAPTASEGVLLSGAGKLVDQGVSSLEALAAKVAAESATRVIVVVTGDRVLTTSVNVAAEHAAHAKNVLPYLVEEQIAQELDDVHIALSPSIGAGVNNVAVVSHQDIIQWLETFYSVGLEVERVVPEYLLVPELARDDALDSAVTILIEAERAVLNYSRDQGTVVDVEHVATYLDLYFARQADSAEGDGWQPGRDIKLIVAESDNQGRSNAAVLSKKLPQHKLDIRLFSESVFLLQAMTAVRQGSSGLNLLQGGYQVQTPRTQGFAWKRVAAIAVIFLFVETAMLLGSGWWFNQKADTLHQAAIDEYRSIFPEERRVINPRRQFQSHLNRQQSATFSAEFLYLVQELAQAMPDSSTLPIKSLRYDAYGNGLQVDLQSDSMDGLDSYTQKLSSDYIRVELLSANKQGEFVSGRIRLEAI